MQLNIKTNFPEVAKAMKLLRQDVVGKATASALNKTVAQGETLMSRAIREEFVLPAAKVKQALRINRARASGGAFNLQASLESPSKRGRSLNLANFAARQTAKGVTFKIKRGGARKLIPGAFLINGGKTVMIRQGKRRLPIKALQTIDVAQMFNTKRINSKVLRFIEDKFPTIFANEARFFTNRFNQAGK
jgi:Prophage minor tail protein Z (GPZ)